MYVSLSMNICCVYIVVVVQLRCTEGHSNLSSKANIEIAITRPIGHFCQFFCRLYYEHSQFVSPVHGACY